jgi:FAD/FMN-containing dehydrogenase
MDRRKFLNRSGLSLVLTLWPKSFAKNSVNRRRPTDANWPSAGAWKRLGREVDGNLIPVEFPLAACVGDAASAACGELIATIKNPYFIGDHPGLTQTLGWVDAWFTQPSVYAVVAKNAAHIAAAIDFARENDLRLVVKGGGHSYQGTSNAPDSLLVWTRRMNQISLHDSFVPQACEHMQRPQRAVSCGSGAIWMQAYDVVTTRGSAYVQGGGCTTVGVAGLVQSGGFGSFSKHYGIAAAGLLEAEVVTADGNIRIANALTNPDLFWALKGGGGGTFGIVTKVTLRVRELPEFFGGANVRVTASSDAAFRRLLSRFIAFYREHLFNQHWGEQVHIHPSNALDVNMVSYGLSTEEAKNIWQPFITWVGKSRGDYTIPEAPIIGSIPAYKWWDAGWRKERNPQVFASDPRPNASPNDVWWIGDAGQVAWTVYGFESLWLPAKLLEDRSREQLVNSLFAGSRSHRIELHFNKGLAGAPRDAIEAARDTAMNPAVLRAFALAIVAEGGSGYPCVRGHEPDIEAARKSRTLIKRSTDTLRKLAASGGSYVSESNYFEEDWPIAYWGNNYGRLLRVKKRYDPTGLFFVHNGVGTEGWSRDGFTKPARAR